MAELGPHHFTFNEPSGACVTCSGLGTYLQVHPNLLVPDKTRSIVDGAFVHQAFNYDPDRWDGRTMYSLAAHYGFDLDTPFADLPENIIDILYHGTHGEEFRSANRKARVPSKNDISAEKSVSTASLPESIDTIATTENAERHTPAWRISPKGNGRTHLPRLQRRETQTAAPPRYN